MNKRLRARCEARIRDLAVPVPFDIHEFCLLLEERRERPIKLFAVGMPHGLYGLWIATDEADHIFYEKDTSLLHQRQIILHEVSHLLFGHRAPHVSGQDLSRAHGQTETDALVETPLPGHLNKDLFPDLDPEMVRRAMARSSYSAVEEQEAEMLASIILQRASKDPSGGRTMPPEAPSMDRLGAALSGRPDGHA